MGWHWTNPPTHPPLPLACGGTGLGGRALGHAWRPHDEPSVACQAHSRCPAERDRTEPVSLDGPPLPSSEHLCLSLWQTVGLQLGNDRDCSRSRVRERLHQHCRLVEPSTDCFQLPRLHVHDWDGDAFSRQLSACFEGLTSNLRSLVSISAGRATVAREVRRSAIRRRLCGAGRSVRRQTEVGPTRSGNAAHGRSSAGR